MVTDVQRFLKSEQDIRERLDDGAEEMEGMRGEIADLNKKLADINETMLLYMTQNAELLDIYKGFKATVRVFGMVERFCVFLLKVSAAAAALWATWKYIIMQTIQHGSKGP